MKKSILTVGLAVFIIGVIALFNSTFPGQLNAQELKCWCCINGEVVETTQAVCKEKGGICYKTKDEALKNCQQKCKSKP